MPFSGIILSLASSLRGAWGGGVVPDVPGNFLISGRTATTIDAAWDALPAGVTARVMWVGTGGDWADFIANDFGLTGGSYSIANLSADTAYDIRIRAEGTGGNSDWVPLNGVYTRPAVPTGFAVASGAYAQVNLTWDALPGGQTANLYVAGLVVAASLAGTSASYNDGSPNHTANYSITAVGVVSGLESVRWANVSGTSGAGSAPVNTSPPVAATISGGTVSATTGVWTADPTATFSYEWEVHTGEGDWQAVESGDAATIGASVGNNYRCNVIATNVLGSGSTLTNEYLIY